MSLCFLFLDTEIFEHCSLRMLEASPDCSASPHASDWSKHSWKVAAEEAYYFKGKAIVND
eukprot:gene11405-9913_t